ncbi:hypothetical protein [Citreimonas salinaria]|nr:hypothetical protein [Citreimonas salinaria]
MRLLVPFVRVLCIALLLPTMVLAATQTDHAPTSHDCCDDAALTSAHHAEAAAQADNADAGPGKGGQRSGEAFHISCGLHACNWIDATNILVPRPVGLIGTRYAAAGSVMPPFMRAESLDRPPAVSS